MAVAMTDLQRLGSVVGPGASGKWRANRDFSLRNLTCKAGEVLPPRWQQPELIDYLKRQYGDDCVLPAPDTQGRRKKSPAKVRKT